MARIYDAPRVAIEENFHIWPNLTTVFRSWLIWTLPLGSFGVWFQCHSHTPIILHQLWPFWANLDLVVERRQLFLSMSMRRCFSLKFNNFGIIFAAARYMPQTSVKIAWHEPNDMPTALASSLIVIRRLFKIIYFTASIFSSVVEVLGRLDIFTAFFKPVLPQLNLCSAHSRLAKYHSQHFKYPCIFNFIFYTRLNTHSLIHFFE